MDTYEYFLEDQHDRGEYEQWLTMVEENWQPTPLARPQPITVCRDCGQARRVYDQVFEHGLPTITQAECKNPECLLLDVTLSAKTWATITERELDAYRAMNRKAVSA